MLTLGALHWLSRLALAAPLEIMLQLLVSTKPIAYTITVHCGIDIHYHSTMPTSPWHTGLSPLQPMPFWMPR